MTYNPSTGKVGYKAYPTGGGGGGVSSVATNDATGITGGTITSTGTLALDTALIVQTKADVQRKLDSAATANQFSFRGTTTDFRPFKYIGDGVTTFKGFRGGFGVTYDSTSAGDTVLIASIDTSHTSTGITTWNDVTRIVDSLNAADEFNNQITYADAGGGTTMTVSGGAITATGTGTAVSVGTGSNYSNKTRLEYLVTAASATAVAGWRQATTKFFLGNTSGQGGFTYTCYFGNATGASTATTRCFVGMQSSTSAPTDVEPSTLVNMFGVGWEAADGNLQFFNNDGTGTATKTDLGGSFPVPTTDRSVGYKLFMYSAPNSSVVSYVLTHLNSGATASGSVSSDLPANTLFLGGRGYMSVGGTSSIIGIALIKQYIKSGLL